MALLMMALLAGLFFFGMSGLNEIAASTSVFLESLSSLELSLESLPVVVGTVLKTVISVMLPLAATAFFAALIANLFQVGFLFTGESLKPDITKLNPLVGLKRVVSLRGVMKLTFGIIKVCIIGAVLAWTLFDELSNEEGKTIHGLLHSSTGESVVYGLRLVMVMLARGCVALLLLALIDYAYQRWQHEKDLRMSKQEIREELMQMEGDPKVKDRRRKVQREILSQNRLREVSDADVVISNPTHFAVVIKYERGRMVSPKCVAKGQDLVARRIREVAMENEVPVVVRPRLARSLYAGVETGQEIPEKFCHTVAEVLAYVYKLAKRPRASADSQVV